MIFYRRDECSSLKLGGLLDTLPDAAALSLVSCEVPINKRICERFFPLCDSRHLMTDDIVVYVMSSFQATGGMITLEDLHQPILTAEEKRQESDLRQV